jgi:hypothetical protein
MTIAPVVARAANMAAVAQDIMNSVVVSGIQPNVTGAAAPTESAERIEAESSLSNACSCQFVEPTATVTSSYTVPPVVSLRFFNKESMNNLV